MRYLKNKKLFKACLNVVIAFVRLIFTLLFAGLMFTVLIDLVGYNFFHFAWNWKQQLEIYGIALLAVIVFTYWLSRLLKHGGK